MNTLHLGTHHFMFCGVCYKDGIRPYGFCELCWIAHGKPLGVGENKWFDKRWKNEL